MSMFTLYSSFLLSTDVFHVHRDQVDPSYAKEALKHPLTVPGLVMAQL